MFGSQGINKESDLRSISDVFSPDPSTRPSDNLGAIFMESLVLLVHSSSLANHFVQPSLRAQYLARRRPTPPRPSPTLDPEALVAPLKDGPDFAPSAFASGPKPLPDEFIRLERALTALVTSLPPQFRDPSRPVLGGVPPWTR